MNKSYPQFTHFEKKLMRTLLKVASQEQGLTKYNPMVAAAVVKGEDIIAIGSYQGPGTKHAEAQALAKAGRNAQGASIYLNLEPCTHFGQNPPCANLIIESGIAQVIYAAKDPNPLVRQQSSDLIFQQNRIAVRTGLLEKEAILLNEVFYKNKLFKLPFVILKTGLSLDNKIALKSGESKYITSEKARKDLHKLRRSIDGVLVGINTILIDNPSLDVRYELLKEAGREYSLPYKIILDSNLRIPLNAKVVTENPEKTIIITKEESRFLPKYTQLNSICKILIVNTENGLLSWHSILKDLFDLGICSLIIEGGSQVYQSALRAQVVDKLILYQAPKLFLDDTSLSAFGGPPKNSLSEIIELENPKITNLKPDLKIQGYLNNPISWLSSQKAPLFAKKEGSMEFPC